MNLAFLTPGTGNYYCGVCMRDNSLARALMNAGHEVTMLPTYLPHFLDEEPASPDQPIFFGGINVYLQHKFAIFRHTPGWLDRAFDSKWLLRKAADRSHMTSGKDLGEITLSTFRGEDGPLAKEVRKVIDWFRKNGAPDVLLLSTILLAGIGRSLKRELGVPTYGFLQGEDSFLDSLPAPYRGQAWELLSQDADKLDGCIAPSHYFGEEMKNRLSLPADKLSHLPNGISLEGYAPAETSPQPPALGFLARQCPLKGLDLLVDAYLEIMKRGNHPDLELRVAGGMTGDDNAYVHEQKKKLKAAGLLEKTSFYPNLDRDEKLAFLRDLTLLCVPSRYPEAFGLYVLEALAAGIPVVLPSVGAFPEIIKATQGGRLYDPKKPEHLPDALEASLANPEKLKQTGLRGHQAVSKQYSNQALANRLVETLRPTTKVFS